MARSDEILLPDGRRLPFRRTPAADVTARAARDVAPSGERASHRRDRRHRRRPREEPGRVVDLEA